MIAANVEHRRNLEGAAPSAPKYMGHNQPPPSYGSAGDGISPHRQRIFDELPDTGRELRAAGRIPYAARIEQPIRADIRRSVVVQ